MSDGNEKNKRGKRVPESASEKGESTKRPGLLQGEGSLPGAQGIDGSENEEWVARVFDFLTQGLLPRVHAQSSRL